MAGHKEPAWFASIVAPALGRLILWAERARQRRTLLALDSRMLKDIGVTRADVMHECDKPFWRK